MKNNPQNNKERNKSMIFNKQLTENITLIYGDLNNWEYNENNVQYPIMYCLVFKFYGHEYEAYFTHKQLQDGDSYPASLYGNTDLFDSFNKRLEDGDFLEEIKQACAEIWDDEKDEDYS